MELWDYSVDMDMFARVGFQAFRQCEACDSMSANYGKLGIRMERCGGAAMKGISWEGIEGKHSLLLCDRHLIAYAGPRNDR